VSQRSVFGLIAAVNAGVPALAFTAITCAAGSVEAPAWYVNETEEGVAVADTVTAGAVTARTVDATTIEKRSSLPTPCLSPKDARVLVRTGVQYR
jgi:hypothetical protein